MKTIFEAINMHVVTEPHNDFYNAVAGRFTYGRALEGSPVPYAVFFGMPSANADTFDEAIEDSSFQINVFCDSYVEAGEIMKMVRSLFNGVTLEAEGYRDITFIREMSTQPWQDGIRWVASIEFSFNAQEE